MRLLLISRDNILEAIDQGASEAVFRTLAGLYRQGYHILATAPQPEEWTGEHGTPDEALLGPESIRKRLADAGGQLDGVYYVRRSFFTQRRIRETALEDILNRYGAQARDCKLLSSKKKFLQVAADLGFDTTLLTRPGSLLERLQQLYSEPENPSNRT